MKAWIARDKNGCLFAYSDKPFKMAYGWTTGGDELQIFDIFPQVKWEDEEPTEVELTIKIKRE